MTPLFYDVIGKSFGGKSVGHGYLLLVMKMRQYTIYIN
jgi:hypothetical protein